MGNCLECGEKLVGREDKKFCNDSCRSSYNNKLNQKERMVFKEIDTILKHNYRVLKELNPEGKTKVHLNKLAAKKFDFQYFTNVLQTKNGHTYHFVYDQGYLPLEKDYYILVKSS